MHLGYNLGAICIFLGGTQGSIGILGRPHFDKQNNGGHFTDRVRKIRGSNSSTFLEVGGWFILTAPGVTINKTDCFFLFEKNLWLGEGCGLVWFFGLWKCGICISIILLLPSRVSNDPLSSTFHQ